MEGRGLRASAWSAVVAAIYGRPAAQFLKLRLIQWGGVGISSRRMLAESLAEARHLPPRSAGKIGPSPFVRALA